MWAMWIAGDDVVCSENLNDLYDVSEWSEYEYNRKEAFNWVKWMMDHELMVHIPYFKNAVAITEEELNRQARLEQEEADYWGPDYWE